MEKVASAAFLFWQIKGFGLKIETSVFLFLYVIICKRSVFKGGYIDERIWFRGHDV